MIYEDTDEDDILQFLQYLIPYVSYILQEYKLSRPKDLVRCRWVLLKNFIKERRFYITMWHLNFVLWKTDKKSNLISFAHWKRLDRNTLILHYATGIQKDVWFTN